MLCIALSQAGHANDTLRLTLDDAIVMSRTRSLDAAVALDELRSAYWQYRSHKADLLPEVSLNATLPYLSRSYNSYQNSDGSYTFVRNNYLQMNGRINIRQNIWLTGGTVSLSSSLDYLKTLTGDRNERYMSTPVTLSLSQPLFGVNYLKWNRRIEPVTDMGSPRREHNLGQGQEQVLVRELAVSCQQLIFPAAGGWYVIC